MPTDSPPDVEVLLVSPSGRRIRAALEEVQPGQWSFYREGAIRHWAEVWKTRDEAIGAAEYRGWHVEIIS